MKKYLLKPLAAWCLAAPLALQAAPGGKEVKLPELETLTVAPLPPANPYRLYLSDLSIGHIVDGRLHVIDGEKMKYLGVIATGYVGQSVLSPDRKSLYVATTYYTRLSHGERHDVLDIHDPDTLRWLGEIPIPPRHAQALNYRGLIHISADGRWLYLQNATPATSVLVVDLQQKKAVAEVPTPGCWAIYPSTQVHGRFAALCGDGTMMTVTLDDQGQVKGQKRSAKFFDPDKDPLFVTSERVAGDNYLFVSYHGQVHQVDVSGEEAKAAPSWSLVAPGSKEAKARWRPGGYQLLAAHDASGRLFVTMHDQGKEGSHKNPAKEIWVYDFKSHARVGRLPGHNAISMAVSQNDKPRLFAIDGLKNAIAAYDVGAKPRFLKRMEAVAESPIQVELH